MRLHIQRLTCSHTIEKCCDTKDSKKQQSQNSDHAVGGGGGGGSNAAPAIPFNFPPGAKFPPQCTSEQLGVLKVQLPGDGCVQSKDRPWVYMDCSFAVATQCGNANPHWFYDFIQQDQQHENGDDSTFRAIIVGCNKGYEAVELLRIASLPSNDSKYDWKAWKKHFMNVDTPIDESEDCPIPGKFPSNTNSDRKRKSQIYCIEGFPKTFSQLEKTKATLGYGDDELDLTNIIIDSESLGPLRVYSEDPIGAVSIGYKHWKMQCRKHDEKCFDVDTIGIDDWVKTKPGLVEGKPPIHFMSITAEGSDYDILKGAFHNLNRIQYIDFGYNWNWKWGDKSFKNLILRLKEKGFVCYFTGSNGTDLWRITDCWQEHYEIKFAASVGCVNANIQAAEPLLNRMEGIFLETLKRKNY